MDWFLVISNHFLLVMIWNHPIEPTIQLFFVGCESFKSKLSYFPSKQRGPEFEDVDEKLQESFDELLAEAVNEILPP